MNSYHNEEGYLQMLQDTLEIGEKRSTRNGTVFSRFGLMITFDVSHKFPLLTSKKMFTKGIIEELIWFIQGSTDAKKLQEKGVHIWDGNSSRTYLDSIGLTSYTEGELGPVYGWQWRSFGKSYDSDDDTGVDQIRYVLEELMKPDNSRRAVLSAWNPKQLSQMALPPCHMLYTFYKDSKGISCMMMMRSSDLFLGLPFNIASTALLTHIFATVLHMHVGSISLTLTDAHIYEEHIDAVKKQLQNHVIVDPSCKLSIMKSPPELSSIMDEKIKWIESLQYEDFVISDYQSAGVIKAPMK
jgi:dihydrofolate reductase/thymidylate synthase